MSAASSSSSAATDSGDGSPRGAIEAKIAAVEAKIEKAEAEIAEVKAKIALFEAFPSLKTFDDATDLAEFAAFARGDRARQRNALRLFLDGDQPQQLAELQGTLKELQGTLKEFQHKENALRDEKARFEAGHFTAQARMFNLHLEFTLSSETHPFRIALWHALQNRNLSVAGTCSRASRVVTIDFFFEAISELRPVKDIFDVLLREYYNSDPQTIESPASLENALKALNHFERVPRIDDILGRSWRYEPESDKRSPHPSPCKRPRGNDDAGWAKPPEGLRRKTPSGSSRSSDNKQKAHILFENKYQKDMKDLIKLADGYCGTTRTEEERDAFLKELCNLTHRLDYNVHQDLDNLRFFWSWRFTRRDSDGAWQVQLSPKYASGSALENQLLPQMQVFGPIEDADKDKWVQALVIRKYLVYMLKLGVYNVDDLKAEWGGLPDESECSKPPDQSECSKPPDQSEYSNPPDQTECSDTPDQTECSDTPDQTEYSNPPDQSELSNPPDQSECSDPTK